MKDESDGRLRFGFGAAADTQHSVTYNFSMVFCVATSDAKCQADKRWKWKELVSGRLTELVHLVRGTDRKTNRAAWHYLLVNEEVMEEFQERTRGGSLDVADSGCGGLRSGSGQWLGRRPSAKHCQNYWRETAILENNSLYIYVNSAEGSQVEQINTDRVLPYRYYRDDHGLAGSSPPDTLQTTVKFLQNGIKEC